ncbi:LOG family protein [Candidatus Peregrinibacteria bacterium]|nr:LOG family protein [Candidatus Peregrinibacteria bacterium]
MKNKIPKHIDVQHFRVAIFGSARIKPNDPRYKQIYSLAHRIAAAGFDVVTGGGPGIMEAANKGHKEGRKKGENVHSFGLNIMLPQEQLANKHLDIKKDFQRFSERLDYFMHLSNVVVVAPGGVGTLLEFFYTWQLIQVEHICNLPIIFMGDMWPDLIKWIEKWPLKKRFLDRKDLNPIFLAEHCAEAMRIIKKTHEEYQKGGADFCKNYQKYKI